MNSISWLSPRWLFPLVNACLMNLIIPTQPKRIRTMIQLQKHAQEIFWLQRRIQFLEALDKLLELDVTAEEATVFAKQFSKVENPTDLVKRLKEIYGEDLE
jgi:hypothetical protein